MASQHVEGCVRGGQQTPRPQSWDISENLVLSFWKLSVNQLLWRMGHCYTEPSARTGWMLLRYSLRFLRKVAVLYGVDGVPGLLSHAPAELRHFILEVGERVVLGGILSLCRPEQQLYRSHRQENRYLSLPLSISPSFSLSLSFQPTCISEARQHQHGSCKVQSHLGCELQRRKRKSFISLPENVSILSWTLLQCLKVGCDVSTTSSGQLIKPRISN